MSQRVSTNDSGSKHPYLISSKYASIATELLREHKLSYTQKHIKFLEHQIRVCRKEMEKKVQ